MFVYNNQIYYVNIFGFLCRINTDGTNSVIITGALITSPISAIESIFVNANGIYVTGSSTTVNYNGTQQYGLFRSNLDGSNPVRLYNTAANNSPSYIVRGISILNNSQRIYLTNYVVSYPGNIENKLVILE